MPLGTNATTTTTAATFIPEQWSNEVIAIYEASTPLRNFVSRYSMVGKKAKTVHIPKFVSPGEATPVTEGAEVTPQVATQQEVQIAINRWYKVPYQVTDIAELQAMPQLRENLVKNMAYRLARRVEHDLHMLGTGLNGGTQNLVGNPGDNIAGSNWTAAVIGGDGKTLWDPTANANTGNGSALTDAGLRQMIQTLEDADIPMNTVGLFVPPVVHKSLRGISAFVDYNALGPGAQMPRRVGQVGTVWGIPVHYSTVCPKVLAADNSTLYRACMLLASDAFVFVEQMPPRIQDQYKLEFYSTLLSADIIYGAGEQRDDAGIVFIVPKD